MREALAAISFAALIYANFVGAAWEGRIVPVAIIAVGLAAWKHRKSFI